MNRIGLVHFYTINLPFLENLKSSNVDLTFVSYPEFARPQIDSEALQNLYPKVLVQNIDNYNYSLNIRAYSPLPIESTLEIEYIALAQSYRLVGLADLSFVERVSLVRLQIASLAQLLHNLDLHYLFFGGNPHSLSDFILCRLAPFFNIRVLTFQDFPIAPLRAFLFDINQKAISPSVRYKEYDRAFVASIDTMSTLLSTSYEDCGRITYLRGNNDMKIIDDAFTRSKIFYNSQSEGLSILEQIQNSNLSANDVELGTSYYNKILNLCSDSIHESCVCVFLHVEPEAAVNPGGNLLLTQIETIRKLRHLLDMDISIVLKEHPSMFVQPSSKIVDSHQIYRSDFFFNLIDSLPNVSWVSPDYSNKLIFENALASFSMGGSVCFESYLNNCPCILSNYSPVSLLYGSFSLEKYLQSNQQLTVSSLLEARKKLSSLDSKSKFEMILSQTIPGSPNGSTMLAYSPTSKEVASSSLSLSQYIVDYISNQ